MWDWDARAIENLGRERRRDMEREARRQGAASAAVDIRRAGAGSAGLRKTVGLMLVRFGIRLVVGTARPVRSRSTASSVIP
ncbi:MAG: hypothetical protein HY660_02930 [Armatimonadetes bacterium]|nr:hypothetical protein [Armatimonadota bacterium]